MMENKSILLPSPIIDAKEDRSLKQLTDSNSNFPHPKAVMNIEDSIV